MHVCEKCCAEFFKWADLLAHKEACTKNPLVLIVGEDEPAPPSEDFPEASPASSASERADSEAAEEAAAAAAAAPEGGEAVEARAPEREDEPMEVGAPADKGFQGPGAAHAGQPPPPPGPEPAPGAAYGMPSTNVTLETLLSTKVAVAQFSQTSRAAGAAGPGGGVAAAALPLILEQLVALQQQQVQQLQLIEQIRSQVALMSRPLPPSRPPLHPGPAAHPTLPLSAGTGPAATAQGPAAPPAAYEGPQHLAAPASTASTPHVAGGGPSVPEPGAPACSGAPATSTASTPAAGASGGASRPQNAPTPPALGPGPLLTSTPSLPSPLLPQTSASTVIFPNPLVSIAATAKRMQTRPDASLSRDSPSRICIMREGIGTRAAIAETAIGSVGETMAAKAKATGNGTEGIIQCTKKPTPITVKMTRPSAISRMMPLSRKRPSLGMRQPSRNNSGGRNSRKKMLGSSCTRMLVTEAIAAPSPICTSGSGTARGSTRTMESLTTTARSISKTMVIVSTANPF